MTGGIGVIADDIAAELKRKLPGQRKTQRNNLALLVAAMLEARSANLMDLAKALLFDGQSAAMRYQWITRVLGNSLINPDTVMAPLAGEVLRHEAEAGYVMLMLDQFRLSTRHQVLMLAVRHRDRALPLAWRVQAPADPIKFAVQRELIQAVASWLPKNASVWLIADGFEGTSSLICFCQAKGWGYQLRLENTPSVRHRLGQLKSTEPYASSATYYPEDLQIRARLIKTNGATICEPYHKESYIIATFYKWGYFPMRDKSQRLYIEGMFSELQSRGLGIEHTRLRYPDRLARLLLIMALALYHTVSESSWDQTRQLNSTALPIRRRSHFPQG